MQQDVQVEGGYIVADDDVGVDLVHFGQQEVEQRPLALRFLHLGHFGHVGSGQSFAVIQRPSFLRRPAQN